MYHVIKAECYVDYLKGYRKGREEGKGTGGLGWGGGLCLRGTTLHPKFKLFFVRKENPHLTKLSNNSSVVFFCFFLPLRLLPHLPSNAPYTASRFYKGFITRNTAEFQQMRERRNILKWPTPQYVFFSLQLMILPLASSSASSLEAKRRSEVKFWRGAGEIISWVFLHLRPVPDLPLPCIPCELSSSSTGPQVATASSTPMCRPGI